MRWPVLLSIGFRPWFLLMLACGGLIFAAWGLPWLIASTGLHINLAPLTVLTDWRWHAHEMIFGVGFALLAGFLLTAVQNWTGRRPLPPIGLLATTLVWLCARGLFLFAGMQCEWAYLLSIITELVVGTAIFSVILRARQWHNLLFPFSLLLMAVLDGYFGVRINDTHLHGQVAILGLWPLLAVVLFIAQRVIPAFTSGRAGVRSQSMGKPAAFIFGAGPLLLLLLGLVPPFAGLGIIWGVSATVIVLLGWWGIFRWWHPVVLSEPMLLVLYAGFSLMLTGLMLMTLDAWFFMQTSSAAAWLDAGVHGIGLGILGVLGPGMLLRVSAGHSGRAIAMPKWLSVFFIAAVIFWLIRVAAPVFGYNPLMLGLSAWGMAAVYFSLLFAVAPWLVLPRADGRL